jgi:hypothetical protein
MQLLRRSVHNTTLVEQIVARSTTFFFDLLIFFERPTSTARSRIWGFATRAPEKASRARASRPTGPR